jgi:hypothetical protein
LVRQPIPSISTLTPSPGRGQRGRFAASTSPPACR